jgi:hypothetical protein
MNSMCVPGVNKSVPLRELQLLIFGFIWMDSCIFFKQKVYGFSINRILSQPDNHKDGWFAPVDVMCRSVGNYLTASRFNFFMVCVLSPYLIRGIV